MTRGLVAISIAKFFFGRSKPGVLDSFKRSTSISPRVSEIHLAARGSEVLKKIFVAGCEEHGLGVLAVAFFELATSLKAEDDGVSVLAIFGHGGMELGQFIEAGEPRPFVKNTSSGAFFIPTSTF